jgi:hypothetical protein
MPQQTLSLPLARYEFHCKWKIQLHSHWHSQTNNYEKLFKIPCYAIAFVQAQSTLLFRQNTRPCAIHLAYDHTVTLTLKIKQS